MVADKVSVIIPCFNQARFLNDAVYSILRQTHTNWECIIVNDGSTDNTEQVANELVQLDNRMLYLEQANKGLPGARNTGLGICSGNFIQFLDADDLLHPEKFEKHIQQIRQSKLKPEDKIVAYSQCHHFNHDDINVRYTQSVAYCLSSQNPLKELILNWENKLSITPNSYFFSANIFIPNGIRFDEEITTCEDIDCWIRILQLKPHLLFLKEKLAYYRNTPGSLSKNMEKVCNGHVQVMEKHMRIAGKGTPLFKWARYKKNEVLFRYRRFNRMDWFYKLYFIRGLFSYYGQRLFSKLHLAK